MSNTLRSHRDPSNEGRETHAGKILPASTSSSVQFDRLQALFDRSFKAARVGIWECTLPDQVITWTDTVYDIFELEPGSSLLRQDTVDMYTPESRQKLTEIRNASIAEGDGFTLDAQIVTAKGNLRWIRITAIVERENGTPVRIFGMKQDITAEKNTFEHIRQLAETDALTGLASRMKFEAVLGEAVAGRSARPQALLLGDLDGFKAVNDRLGHQAGDECLKDAGRRILQAAPGASLVARLGGDEFAIIHPCDGENSLKEIGQRIVANLECWVGSHPGKLKISGSVGAALIVPGMPAKDVFAQADRALYAVKAKGKNGFELSPDCEPIADVA
jgi:diguanylate cyclase (GGDEF)-like protein